ncbi:hypothetical protein KL941_000025 [Ogataea angusta]|nr:hypothetical protein KL941_000025 [Ogataea angusta]
MSSCQVRLQESSLTEIEPIFDQTHAESQGAASTSHDIRLTEECNSQATKQAILWHSELLKSRQPLASSVDEACSGSDRLMVRQTAMLCYLEAGAKQARIKMDGIGATDLFMITTPRETNILHSRRISQLVTSARYCNLLMFPSCVRLLMTATAELCCHSTLSVNPDAWQPETWHVRSAASNL